MIKSKRFASMLVLLVAFIMLFSVLFIALEADHDCCGEDCCICAQIRVCEGLLRNLLTASVFVATVCFFYALSRVFAGTDIHSVRPHTLILLKVKLSD